MYNTLHKDKSLDKSKKEVENLLYAVQNTAIYIPKHQTK
jgi:hypothetical protein